MPGYGYGISQFLTSTKSAATGGGPFEYTPIDNNYSMEFDGANNIVTGINTGTNDVTICYWIKTTTTHAYTLTQCAFGGRNNGSGDNYTLGRLGSAFSTPNDTKVRVFNTLGTTKLNDGNWHFIAYTYDYTTKEVKAYVDGNTTPEVTATFPGYSTSFPISIGNNGLILYFTGNVDECAYFNSVLSESTIEAIYNTTNDSDTGQVADLSETPEGAPVAWYRFE